MARADSFQSANQPRRVRRWHPDFDAGGAPDRLPTPANADVAIDFVDMSAVVDRIHAAFFYGRL